MATKTREKHRENRKKGQKIRSLSPVIADHPTLNLSPGPSAHNFRDLQANSPAVAHSSATPLVTLSSISYPSVQSPTISTTCDIEDSPGTSAEAISEIKDTAETAIAAASPDELIADNNNVSKSISSDSDATRMEPSAPDISCIENYSEHSVLDAPPTLAQGLNILEQRNATIGAKNNAVPGASSASVNNEQECQLKKVSTAKGLGSEGCSAYFSNIEHARERFGITKMANEQLCVKVYYDSESYIKDERSKYLLDLLSDYCDSVKIADRKRKQMLAVENECNEERSNLWSLERKMKTHKGRCADGKTVELRVSYEMAMLLKDKMARLRRKYNESLTDMTSGLCVFWHRSSVAKLKVDDVIHSELNETMELRSALVMLLTHLNRTDASIGELRTTIAQWAYYVAHRLMTKSSDDYTSCMLLINQLVRQARSISWALPLVQIVVQSVEDCTKMLVAFATILDNTRVNPANTADVEEDIGQLLKKKDPSSRAEGMEFTLVEREGEEVSVRDPACTLSESDLLGLLRQMPVADTLHSLMLLRTDIMSGELSFQGDPSHGPGVLKAMLGAWEVLKSARRALLVNTYRDVSHWLCRLVYLTLHCVADLHEATVGDASQPTEVRAEIQLGLNRLFCTGVEALLQCKHRDIADPYSSHAPFQMMSDGRARYLFDQVRSFRLENTKECYYTLVHVQYMALCRNYGTLTEDVARYLYEVGFTRELSREECGAWARSLLAGLMQRHTSLYVYTLLRLAATAGDNRLSGITPAINAEWVRQLELQCWRPTPQQVRSVLEEWTCVDGLRLLCTNIHVDAARAVQNELALLLVQHARRFSVNTVPEWMYQALTNMRLHSVDWQENLDTAPSVSESAIPDFKSESENALTCMWVMLTTSWGHSIPLICEHGVPLMIEMVAADRVREAVHCLSFVMVVMLQSPESIGYTAGFKELLTKILNTGQSYSALMSRLVGKQKELGVDLLETIMRTHLRYTYKKLYHSSPRVLLQCWLQLLTGPYNWSTTSAILHLLNVAIECSYMFNEVVNALTDHFIDILQKRPSQSARTWLSGATFCGLVRIAGPPLPFLWLRALHAEHQHLENKSGVWYALLWQIHKQRDISVDRALEKSGGPQSADGMVIYRTANAIVSTPLTHPVLVYLWQFFFKLYLDRPIEAEASEFAPVGRLFFRGYSKSRALESIAKRLKETIDHHQACLKEAQAVLDSLRGRKQGEGQESSAGVSGECDPADQLEDVQRMIHYHQVVVKQLKNYLNVIEDKPCAATQLQIPTLPCPVRCVDGPGLAERAVQAATTAAPPLDEPWHRDVRDTLLARPPVERMRLRFKDYPPPLGIKQPELKLTALLPYNLQLNIVHTVEECLKDIGVHARQFSCETRDVSAMNARIFELLPRLYAPQPFSKTAAAACGNQCIGPATVTVAGEEWLRQRGVERDIEDTVRFRAANLHTLASPNEKLARLCVKLQLLIRRAEQREASGASAFDSIMKQQKLLLECPPISDTAQTLLEDLAEKYIVKDLNRCLSVLRSGDSWPALARAALKPAELSPHDFPVLYLGLLRQPWTQPHVIFSYLSKFDVKKWRGDGTESLHCDFMQNIFSEMTQHSGAEPKGEQLMLVELLSKHVTELASPYTLRQLVEMVTRSAAAGTLALSVWPHVVRAANAHAPHLSNTDELTEHVRATVDVWWRARFSAMPVCALGERAPHALYAAELAHAYLRATLHIGKKMYAPAECASRAMTQILLWWSGWLRAWWDAGAGSERSPLLPWSAMDDVIATQLLQHFVEDVKLTLDTCAEEGADVLGQMYNWACAATWRPCGCTSEAVLRHASAVLRALRALPWDRVDWFRMHCIQDIADMLTRDEVCRKFTMHTLKGTVTWLPADTDPRQLSAALTAVLRVLTDLDFPAETVERAMVNLGVEFEHLEASDLESVLDLCFLKNHSVERPIHTRPCFQLILAAATLSKSFSAITRSHSSWNACEAKRLSLLARWIRTLGETLAAAGQTPEANKMVADGTQLILKAIQEACVTAQSAKNAVEDKECAESCRALLATAAGTLCTQEFAAIALPVWVSWAGSAPAPMARAALCIVADVTSDECFYTLSDALIQRHLTLQGTWKEIVEVWTNARGLQVEMQLRMGYLHTAYATIQLHTKSAPEKSVQYARIIMSELDGVKITAIKQELPTLMLLYFIFRALPLPREKPDVTKDKPADNTTFYVQLTNSGNCTDNAGGVCEPSEVAAEDVELWDAMQAMLASWTDSGRSRLLKKFFSSPYEASQNFQVMCKYSACAVTAVRERCGRATQADLDLYNKVYEELGNLSRDKVNSALGHAAGTCRGWLRARPTLADQRLRNYYQLYALVYPEFCAYLGDAPA